MTLRTLKTFSFSLYLLALCFFTNSCMVGSEYERPGIDIPQAWLIPVEDANSIADIVWWELFKDETLQSLIRIALDENKDLRISIVRIKEARGAFRATGADRWPQIDAISKVGRAQGSEKISPGSAAVDFYSFAGILSWEVDLWGKLQRATNASYAQLLATEESKNAVVLSLISDIAQAYFEMLDLDRRIAIAERTVKSREESLRIARLRFTGGITSELEVKQAESEFASAKTIVPDFKNQLFAKENELSILLGRNPGSIRRGQTLVEQYLSPEIPAGLQADLLRRRPDIRRAEKKLVASSERVGIAEADFLPSLSLTGILGLESGHFSSLFNSSADIWKIAADVSTPIVTAGRLEGNLGIVKAQFEQARLNYKQSIQQAFREVNDSIMNYYQSKEIRTANEDLVRASSKYLKLAYVMYENGEASYLDFLDAERQLFDAELTLSQTIRDQLVSMVTVYKALGGGWNTKADLQPVSIKEETN